MVATYWVIQVFLENSYQSNGLQVPNTNKTTVLGWVFFQLQRHTSNFYLDKVVLDLEDAFHKWRREAILQYANKIMSIGHYYSNTRTQDVLCRYNLDHSETPDSTREFSNLRSPQKSTVGNIIPVFFQSISRMKQVEVQIERS